MFFFPLYILLFVSSIYSEKTVKYAAVLYRHGDRTPVSPYPKDPWGKEELWPVKFGELTNTGKRQHYALGKWLRIRYTNLLSKEFDPSEIYVKSTDVDRTLMSAQANLAGMFPPSGKSIWSKELMWQPIPIHTAPEDQDEVLAMKKKCEPYTKEKEKYMRSDEYKRGMIKYGPLMDYLTTHTGMKIANYNDILDVYSTLSIEHLYNFTLPNWTLSVFPHKMREPACHSFTINTATPKMAKLTCAPLLKQIVGHMDAMMRETTKNPLKLSIYSGHDLTLGNVLTCLGVYDGSCPKYAATVFLELLHDNTTNAYSVRLSYKNSTEARPIDQASIMIIPHCGLDCPYERFVRLYDDILRVDWHKTCEPQMSQTAGAAIFFFLLAAMYYVVNKIQTRSERRNQNRVQFSYATVYNDTDVPGKITRV